MPCREGLAQRDFSGMSEAKERVLVPRQPSFSTALALPAGTVEYCRGLSRHEAEDNPQAIGSIGVVNFFSADPAELRDRRGGIQGAADHEHRCSLP